MHSSGYARTQSGGNLGAAGAEDFATRKTLETQRKYVQKYKNSRLMNSYYGPQRARTNQAQMEKSCGLGAKRASVETNTGVVNPRRATTWSRPKF